MSVARFSGFPSDGVDFFVEHEADNTKAFWTANKPRYAASVRGPMEALLAEVDDEFGPFHIFRPYNDVRFAKGRPPYKTAIGAVSESQGGSVYYVQFSGTGLMCGAGMYHMASDQLARFREAVDDDALGVDIEGRVRAAERAGYSAGAMEELKTAPRGIAKDHPRIELLRRKGLILTKSWPVGAWLHSRKARERVVTAWHGSAPVTEWLERHVGPSTLPPPDAERF